MKATRKQASLEKGGKIKQFANLNSYFAYLLKGNKMMKKITHTHNEPNVI